MKSLSRTAVTGALAVALLSCFGAANAASSLPPVHESGNVQYVTGGIGKAEAESIQQAGSRWPLMLEFAVKDGSRGDFASDIGLVIRDASGKSILRVADSGPLVLAKLAPGHYVVDATLDGKKLQRPIDVHEGRPSRAFFEWPAGTDQS